MAQREALSDIFRYTLGHRWTLKTNWLSELRAGKWYGVEVNSSGHVIYINLSDNNLVGSLDHNESVISRLIYLERLHLMSNSLSGPIPSAFCSFTSLKELNLSWNLFSGQHMEKIDYGSYLYLHLKGAIPDYLYELTSLTVINLAHNKLNGIVFEKLKNLTVLKYLDVCSNQLNGKY